MCWCSSYVLELIRVVYKSLPAHPNILMETTFQTPSVTWVSSRLAAQSNKILTWTAERHRQGNFQQILLAPSQMIYGLLQRWTDPPSFLNKPILGRLMHWLYYVWEHPDWGHSRAPKRQFPNEMVIVLQQEVRKHQSQNFFVPETTLLFTQGFMILDSLSSQQMLPVRILPTWFKCFI